MCKFWPFQSSIMVMGGKNNARQVLDRFYFVFRIEFIFSGLFLFRIDSKSITEREFAGTSLHHRPWTTNDGDHKKLAQFHMQQATLEQGVQGGRCASTDGMLELDNLQRRGNNNFPNDNSAPKQHDDDALDDGDYEYDDDDDDHDGDGISSSYLTAAASDTYRHQQRQGSTTNVTFFLGRAFYPTTDQLAMHAFQKSLYWLTYRSDLVVPLRPYSNSSTWAAIKHPQLIGEQTAVTGCCAGMKSDAGWGCMLRSAQMMLAQAVRRHYHLVGGRCNNSNCLDGEGHQPSKNKGTKGTHCKQDGDDPWEAERIAQWFADFPNHAEDDVDVNGDDDNYDFRRSLNRNTHDESLTKPTTSSKIDYPNLECYGNGGITYHWYSLHQMVAAGIGLGILPGEWYGPTTACHVLRELNEIHCDRREKLAKRLFTSKADCSDGDKPETARNNKHTSSEATPEIVPSKSISIPPCDMFRVHIATEGCIYIDAIMKLMTQSKCGGSDVGNSTEEANNHVRDTKYSHDQLSTKVDEIDDPLRKSLTQVQHHHGVKHYGLLESKADILEWDTSLLLLLPLRLGIESISTSDYGSSLAKLIAFPHSVGMLGGTPRHALWFYGADATPPPSVATARMVDEKSSNDQGCVAGGWYGLDPHTVQSAPRGTRVLVEQTSTNHKIGDIDDANRARHQWQVQITDAYLRSLHISPTLSHPNNQRSIPLSKLDPSCALGFYIRDHADFVYFQRLIQSLSEEHCRPNKLPEIITVMEKTPNYEMDVSSAIKCMIGKDGMLTKDTSSADDLDEFSTRSEKEEEDIDDEEDDDDNDFVLV